MSEPEWGWYVDRIKIMLRTIEGYVTDGNLTNSKREIILHDTNEIEIDLHIIIRKLCEQKDRKDKLIDKDGESSKLE